MRNAILFAVSVLLVSTGSTAQTIAGGDDKKFSIGLNIGASIPMKQFGKADTTALPAPGVYSGKKQDTNSINGYARRGFYFDVDFSYRIFHHLSIMLSYDGNINSFDIATLNSQVNSQNEGLYISPVEVSGNYYLGQYLIGPKYDIHVAGKFSLEFRALAGIVTANYPSVSFPNNNSPGFTLEVSTTSFKPTSGFEYSLGMGFKYSIINGLMALHFNVNYAGANLIYPNYTITNTNGGWLISSNTYQVPKTMTLGLVQVTGGVSLEL